MKTIKFECEVVTPMFLAGADGRTPELRPPSIKGAMRFWWRAMNGHLPLEELKKKEAKIFGGSGENEGRSKVIIRIKNSSDLKRGVNIKTDYNLAWYFNSKNRRLEGKDSGIGYLLYSTVLRESRFYFEDGQSFEINFMSNDLESLKQAVSSFWALSYLGGIGTRARRGGGNISIVSVVDNDNILKDTEIDFVIKGNNNEEVSAWLIRNYQKARAIVNEGRDTDFVWEYSNLSISRFVISNRDFGRWQEALNDAGKRFLEFRTDNKSDIFKAAVFGLPWKHIETNDKNVNRRSSPLIFKILKVGDKYCWLVLRIAGEFLPSGVVLKEKRNRKTQKPDYSKIDEFWNVIKKDNIEKILSMPNILKDIKLRIVKELSPSKIILFGSKGRGDFHKNSDIDIAVDTDTSIGLSNVSGPVDLVNLKDIDGNFRKVIEREGVEI